MEDREQAKEPASPHITVAVLGRARGIRGEITAFSYSSKPERFAELRTVYLYGTGKAYEVERVWIHQGALVFKFEGVDDMSAAELLRDQEVRIPADQRVPLDPGEYFHSDLIGCEVRDDATDRLIGMVTSFEEYGGPALLSVDGGKVLIPFVAAVCTGIHPDRKRIEVSLPEGLESINEVPSSNRLP